MDISGGNGNVPPSVSSQQTFLTAAPANSNAIRFANQSFFLVPANSNLLANNGNVQWPSRQMNNTLSNKGKFMILTTGNGVNLQANTNTLIRTPVVLPVNNFQNGPVMMTSGATESQPQLTTTITPSTESSNTVPETPQITQIGVTLNAPNSPKPANNVHFVTVPSSVSNTKINSEPVVSPVLVKTIPNQPSFAIKSSAAFIPSLNVSKSSISASVPPVVSQTSTFQLVTSTQSQSVNQPLVSNPVVVTQTQTFAGGTTTIIKPNTSSVSFGKDGVLTIRPQSQLTSPIASPVKGTSVTTAQISSTSTPIVQGSQGFKDLLSVTPSVSVANRQNQLNQLSAKLFASSSNKNIVKTSSLTFGNDSTNLLISSVPETRIIKELPTKLRTTDYVEDCPSSSTDNSEATTETKPTETAVSDLEELTNVDLQKSALSSPSTQTYIQRQTVLSKTKPKTGEPSTGEDGAQKLSLTMECTEHFDRASPDLWTEHVPGMMKFVAENASCFQRSEITSQIDVINGTKRKTSTKTSTAQSVSNSSTIKTEAATCHQYKKICKSFSITPFGLTTTSATRGDLKTSNVNLDANSQAEAPSQSTSSSQSTSAIKNGQNDGANGASKCSVKNNPVKNTPTTINQEEVDLLLGFGSLTATGLMDRVKEIQNLAYQLGLEEEREMTRAKFLNVFVDNDGW